MKKKLICIECPQGCELEIGIEGEKVVSVSGHKCPKGEDYAKREIENPVRMLTTTVLAKGLRIKLIPVRTNRPIPKNMLIKAAEYTKKIRIEHPVKMGEVIVKDLLGTGADLIATRSC